MLALQSPSPTGQRECRSGWKVRDWVYNPRAWQTPNVSFWNWSVKVRNVPSLFLKQCYKEFGISIGIENKRENQSKPYSVIFIKGSRALPHLCVCVFVCACARARTCPHVPTHILNKIFYHSLCHQSFSISLPNNFMFSFLLKQQQPRKNIKTPKQK